jgi:hypothetical protein
LHDDRIRTGGSNGLHELLQCVFTRR